VRKRIGKILFFGTPLVFQTMFAHHKIASAKSYRKVLMLVIDILTHWILVEVAEGGVDLD
jgi:hypothetical protein